MAEGRFFGIKLKPVVFEDDGTIGAERLLARIDANDGAITETIKEMLTLADQHMKPLPGDKRRTAKKAAVKAPVKKTRAKTSA